MLLSLSFLSTLQNNNLLTTRDLSHLIRNIKGQILILGDFNGHNYLWGSHDSLANTICVLNDGTHTYLKPHAQHVNKSVIDLTTSTLGLALRNEWEVLPNTHGSNHYPILTSILPPVAEIQPSCDPSHWVFSKAANDSILRAITIPKKSNPWFDVECWQALKARWVLDKWVRQCWELRGETVSAFRRAQAQAQAQARRLLNHKKTSVVGRICLKGVNWYSY